MNPAHPSAFLCGAILSSLDEAIWTSLRNLMAGAATLLHLHSEAHLPAVSVLSFLSARQGQLHSPSSLTSQETQKSKPLNPRAKLCHEVFIRAIHEGRSGNKWLSTPRFPQVSGIYPVLQITTEPMALGSSLHLLLTWTVGTDQEHSHPFSCCTPALPSHSLEPPTPCWPFVKALHPM